MIDDCKRLHDLIQVNDTFTHANIIEMLLEPLVEACLKV